MTFTSRLPSREEYLKYKDEAIDLTRADVIWKPRDHTDDPNGLSKAFILQRILKDQPETKPSDDHEVFHDTTNGLEQVYFFDAEHSDHVGAFDKPQHDDEEIKLKFFDASDRPSPSMVANNDCHLSMDWALSNKYPSGTSYPTYEIDQFLGKLSTDELLHTEEHFDSFAYAVTTAMDHLLDSHHVNMGMTSLADIDVENTQPFLAWAPIEVIRKTLECTTQLARAHERYPMRRH